MKDRKAAKKIIKRFKKHPEWYTEQDVQYAKLFRRMTKKNESSEIGIGDSGRGEDHGVHSQSQ